MVHPRNRGVERHLVAGEPGARLGDDALFVVVALCRQCGGAGCGLLPESHDVSLSAAHAASCSRSRKTVSRSASTAHTSPALSFGLKKGARLVFARRIAHAIFAKQALDLILEFQRDLVAGALAPRAHGAHHRPAAKALRVCFQHIDEILHQRAVVTLLRRVTGRVDWGGRIRLCSFRTHRHHGLSKAYGPSAARGAAPIGIEIGKPDVVRRGRLHRPCNAVPRSSLRLRYGSAGNRHFPLSSFHLS